MSSHVREVPFHGAVAEHRDRLAAKNRACKKCDRHFWTLARAVHRKETQRRRCEALGLSRERARNELGATLGCGVRRLGIGRGGGLLRGERRCVAIDRRARRDHQSAYFCGIRELENRCGALDVHARVAARVIEARAHAGNAGQMRDARRIREAVLERGAIRDACADDLDATGELRVEVRRISFLHERGVRRVRKVVDDGDVRAAKKKRARHVEADEPDAPPSRSRAISRSKSYRARPHLWDGRSATRCGVSATPTP